MPSTFPDPGGISGAVQEITFTSGTGDYTLSGPTAGAASGGGSFFRFADFYKSGERIEYRVTDTSYTEISQGIFNGTDTLTRATFVWSTTGAFINWPSTGQRNIAPIGPDDDTCDMQIITSGTSI